MTIDSDNLRSATPDHSRRVRGYESDRGDVQLLVPADARRILDLGCSTGALGAALKRRNNAYVVGVEIDPAYGAIARERLDDVRVGDVEEVLSGWGQADKPFDCLIAADVLEHLVDPWTALARAANLLRPGSTVIVSLPNVLYWPGLIRIVWQGQWPRDDEGLFDRTHLHWFSTSDAILLLEQAGLDVTGVIPKYFTTGIRLRLTQMWGRTPLRRYLPRQQLFTAMKPATPNGRADAQSRT